MGSAECGAREAELPRALAPFLLALSLAGCGLLAGPRHTGAQTLRPVVVEHSGSKVRSKFELVNDGLLPVNVVLEPRSFEVTPAGEVLYLPLDSSIRLKLSAMSVRIPPRQSRWIFYEVTADSFPAWFVIPCTFSGMPKRSGLEVTVELPHTVYLLQKEALRREDVKVHTSAYIASQGSIFLELENGSTRMGRVTGIEASGPGGKKSYASFPCLPKRSRQLTLPWDLPGVPDRLVVRFQGFTLDMPLVRSSDVAR
jgi:hypothetical protein